MIDAEKGLTTAEAQERLARYGPNELAPPRRFEALREIVHFLANPLVLVLLAASTVSAVLGQALSAGVIAVMVALSVVLNFVQAYNSQRAARRLRARVGQTATVVRDGAAGTILVRDIVPGDVLHLSAGDLVPADACLLKAKDLFLNEATLTGESLPTAKHALVGSDDAVTPR